MHRPLNLPVSRVSDILCHREQLYVGAQLTFQCDRKLIILDLPDFSLGFAGRYIELYDFPARPLEVRWIDVTLPYRVFSKDQRVTLTAIVENKRLSHAPTVVKAQQDPKLPTKVMANSEKTGYKKIRGRSMGQTSSRKRRLRAAAELTV